MWRLLLVPTLMIAYDFLKLPIDTLYFQNPMRPLSGIRNTFRDMLYFNSECSVKNFPGLMLIKFHFDEIKEEFETIHPSLDKTFYHDISPWFEKNEEYYFYKVEHFPILNSLVKKIPCIDTKVAAFAVSEGPMRLYPHRAESNSLLRYHITIQGGGACTLYTEGDSHVHEEGEDFIFDHSRYHELVKEGTGKRVVLILDINR
jgi:hypothetical protein